MAGFSFEVIFEQGLPAIFSYGFSAAISPEPTAPFPQIRVE